MRQTEALSRIQSLGRPVFETDDVAALLRMTPGYASQVLSRLSTDHQVIRLTYGKWALSSKTDKLSLLEFLTIPMPAYVSLQSALYYHGIISQIPTITYCVSLAKSKLIRTPLGDFSIHHVDASFFFGFSVTGRSDVKIASPEKALLDIFYLSAGRSRLFESLPEVEISKNFRVKAAQAMIRRIPSARKRTIVTNRFEEFKKQIG